MRRCGSQLRGTGEIAVECIRPREGGTDGEGRFIAGSDALRSRWQPSDIANVWRVLDHEARLPAQANEPNLNAASRHERS